MIKIEIDSHALSQALNRLEQRTSNLRPAMESIGAALVSDIQGGLSDGRTPWGDPFAPLKAMRGRRVGGQPLMDTRKHIYEKITHNADNNSVEVGMFENEAIGMAHQYGSEKRGIPARAFLPIRNDRADLPSSWEAELIAAIVRHLD